MREGANRSFGLALLASVLLHALLLAALPSLRELAAQLPQVPAPLVARLTQPQAKPVASAPAEEARRPPTPEKRPAPAFDLPDINGGTVSLASLKGKVVVLDFWGFW